MYEEQNTCVPPYELPPHDNFLNFLWTYIYKAYENRRKSHYACNGAPN